MKRNIIAALAILLTTILAGCSLETDNDAGALEGMWHLRTLKRKDAAGQTTITDFSRQRVYWLFQGKLLQLDDKSGVHSAILYRFSITDDKIDLTEPYLYDRENGDRPLADLSYLGLFGIETPTPTYNISVDSKSLELYNDSVRLSFMKF